MAYDWLQLNDSSLAKSTIVAIKEYAWLKDYQQALQCGTVICIFHNVRDFSINLVLPARLATPGLRILRNLYLACRRFFFVCDLWHAVRLQGPIW